MKARLPTSTPASFLPVLFAATLCALFFLFPFVPDEKLTRAKLFFVEEGVAVLLLLAGLRALWTGRPSRTADRRTLWSVAAWAATMTALAFFASDPVLARTELRRVFLGAGLFVALALSGWPRAWTPRLLAAWTAAAALLSVYGLLQLSGGAGRLAVPQMDRVMATFGNPIFFSAYLLPSLFVAIAVLASTLGAKRAAAGAAAALIAAALCATQTRSAWIGAGAGTAFLVVVAVPGRRKWIAFGGLVAAAAVFAVVSREVWLRDQGHALIWRDTIKMALKHPFFGAGLGGFHIHFPMHAGDDLVAKWPKGQFIVNYAHNEYLQVAAETGFAGLAAFLAIPFMALAAAHRIFHAGDRGGLFFAAALVAMLAQAAFSVDMRFGVSFAAFFVLVYFTSARPAAETESVTAAPNPWIRVFGVLAVAGALAVQPALIHPYRAARAMERQKGFFDERLLDPAKTIQDLEALRDRHPEEPAVLERLAYAYAKEIRRRDGSLDRAMAAKAAAAYESLIAADPGRIGAYNNLANIRYMTGDADGATAAWRAAVERDPDFLDAHLNLGKILYVRGELKEAAGHFREALRIDPGNAEATVYLKRMVE